MQPGAGPTLVDYDFVGPTRPHEHQVPVVSFGCSAAGTIEQQATSYDRAAVVSRVTDSREHGRGCHVRSQSSPVGPLNLAALELRRLNFHGPDSGTNPERPPHSDNHL